MNDRETCRYNMFGGIQTLKKNTNTADFAPASKAASHFASATQVIKDLDTGKAEKNRGPTPSPTK